jgi:hypothetical protein
MSRLEELQEQISELEGSIESIEMQISNFRDLIDNASDDIPDYIIEGWKNGIENLYEEMKDNQERLDEYQDEYDNW